MDRAVEAARRFKPELVLLSAGFDACINDPVGDIGLEPETFGELTKQVLELANDTAEGRVISLLEGGYNLDQLTIAALHHLNKLAS
jgi:acetoin utilization deacetylase AcuC-like enzyme